MVLALRAMVDLHVLDVAPLLAGAAIGGIAVTALVAVGEPKLRKIWWLALLAPLLSFYPWGVLATANAVLDRAEPEVFRVAVRGKHVSSGKHTSYELRLEPWGPVTELGTVEVARAVYDATPVGGQVCAVLRPGALGARWFVVLPCPDDERPSPATE
jgi:hypothetical protein